MRKKIHLENIFQKLLTSHADSLLMQVSDKAHLNLDLDFKVRMHTVRLLGGGSHSYTINADRNVILPLTQPCIFVLHSRGYVISVLAAFMFYQWCILTFPHSSFFLEAGFIVTVVFSKREKLNEIKIINFLFLSSEFSG